MSASLYELKAKQTEAITRCKAAKLSIIETQKRLDDVLTAGRDTYKAKGVLKKCHELEQEAIEQKQTITAQIKSIVTPWKMVVLHKS
ncbi:MAG: hypothetical protein L3J59_11630 [Methylococcaceae bacterium]|nr:hypothetical protein [Methylococcaceae bacterium]